MLLAVPSTPRTTVAAKAAPGSVVGRINSLEIEREPDGSFEIIASAEQQGKNWVPIEHATGIGLRQFFYDWEHELPWYITIERVGAGDPPPPLTPEQLDRQLRNAIKFINPGCDLWDGLARAGGGSSTYWHWDRHW